jgi:colanic acid biosynthesis glycosyl transferase WcaI
MQAGIDDASVSGAHTPASKIIFVNRFFFPDESATSRMLSDLAFRLAHRGLSVTVITSRLLYGAPGATLPPREELNGVDVRRVATAAHGRARLAGRAVDYASFHVAAARELWQIAERGDVVVAKSDPPLIALSVALVARAKRVVLVNWLQDLFPELAAALTPRLLPKWLETRLLIARDRTLRRAAMNVVLGERMRDRLLARGINATQIRIVPNWADPTEITPRSPEHSGIRQRLRLEGRFVVGYSGNLGRAHEFDTLLGAAELLRTDANFVFLITGAGAKATALREAVRAAGLANFVFQDYQPRELLADSLAAADAHLVSLLPSLEGLIVPSKIYGILAAGRPAIFIGATDGELARMLREQDCGTAVATGDCAHLAAELRALRDAPSRLLSLGERARQVALTSYTSEHAVASWLSLLDSIAPATIQRAQRTLKYATNA